MIKMTYLYYMKPFRPRSQFGLSSKLNFALFSSIQNQCKFQCILCLTLSRFNSGIFSRPSFNYDHLYNRIRSRCNAVTSANLETQSLEDRDSVKEFKQTEMGDLTGRYATEVQYGLLNNKLEELMKLNQITNEDWDTLKRSVLQVESIINDQNIDAIILNRCGDYKSLRLGKLFFKYLKSTQNKLNRAVYGNYLRLFWKCSYDCSESDMIEVHTVYRELLKLYPLLDTHTAEKAICALSITKHWKQYEEMFKVIKMSYNPSKLVYSVVIIAAFKNKEFDLGWTLMEEMQFQGLSTPDDVYITWLDTVNYKTRDDILTKVFLFLSKFSIKPSLSVSEILKKKFEEFGKGRKGTYTSVFRSHGKCKNCGGKLEAAWVNQKDYNQLKDTFLDPVLIGKDVFLKTRPEEFDAFLKFLKKTAPFNIVLDGLNIAFKMSKNKKTNYTNAIQLKAVVRHFVDRKQKVLVLGRKHMDKWPTEHMSYIYNNASVFLAEDMSQDDPFLLYATLYSGLGTGFVSQDLMRGHKFLLANPKIQATFQRWQAQHQYFLIHVENNGKVHLQEPIPFLQSIQQNGRGDWHVPYVVKEDFSPRARSDNFHRHWLCLLNQPLQKPTYYQDKRRNPNRFV